ncbi:MAG TPA: hypothetical protein VIV12_06575 [Streptosporangiaceae bacterium]
MISSAIREQRRPTFIGRVLADEQEKSGRVRHARSVGVRAQLGVGERRIAGVLHLRVGDHGDAVGIGVAVRPDGHQPPRDGDQHGAVGDAAEGHKPFVAQPRRNTRLLGWVTDIGVVSTEEVHRLPCGSDVLPQE